MMATFKYGPCGADTAECCYAFCCPLCAEATVISELSPNDECAPFCAGSWCGACCLNFIPGIGQLAGRINALIGRIDVRIRNGIPRNDCADCCCVWFCICCSTAQLLGEEKDSSPKMGTRTMLRPPNLMRLN